MKCENCGALLAEDVSFCRECGAKVEKKKESAEQNLKRKRSSVRIVE